jgi:hypothetical protein
MDVWNYLQALMLSVVLAITIGLRIRQWSYVFLTGWLVCALSLMGYAIYLINALQLSDNGMFLLGFFLFSGPLISAVGVLGIFFIAWRGIGNKAHLRDTTFTPLEESTKKQ